MSSQQNANKPSVAPFGDFNKFKSKGLAGIQAPPMGHPNFLQNQSSSGSGPQQPMYPPMMMP